MLRFSLKKLYLLMDSAPCHRTRFLYESLEKAYITREFFQLASNGRRAMVFFLKRSELKYKNYSIEYPLKRIH